MAKMKEHKLPNGLEVFYSSKANLEILQREIFDDNLYDKHGIELKDDDCIFDVGANIGFFVLYLNQRLKDASIYAFEPIPNTFELLERNTERHNQFPLKLYACGLSDQPGEATFTYYPKTNVASTMYPQDSPEYRKNSRRFVLEEIRERGVFLKWLVDIYPGIFMVAVNRRHPATISSRS